MRINKQELHKLVEDLPEPVETDEVLYRLYLHEKLNAAEEDVREGRTLTHEEVMAETAKWFRE
jgi:predicted transcriptional regulator